MMQKIFAIYDEKAKAYLPPFFLPQRGMAIRTFSDCVNSPDHQFGAHPHDYTLFSLGEFNDSDAEILLDRKLIGNGVEYKLQTRLQDDLFDGQEHPEIDDGAPIQPDTEGGNSS